MNMTLCSYMVSYQGDSCSLRATCRVLPDMLGMALKVRGGRIAALGACLREGHTS